MLQITPWELSALQLLAAGTSTAQLAISLGLAEGEMEARLTALFSKMGAKTRTDALNAASRRGLITPTAPNRGA